MTEEEYDELPIHMHKLRIRVLFLSIMVLATRRGQTTNLTFNIVVWRLGVHFGLSYYGN